MTEPSGRWTVVYNGEIYNFLILRKELEDQGITFQTRSDTEVLASLIGLLGSKALNKLRGMFAFSAYDRRSRNHRLRRLFGPAGKARAEGS